MALSAKESSAVLRAPVEIWKEIIDLALFDPALTSIDPFYPGCNLHSAFNEWNDVELLRKHEVQRGLLRLVCRSWKSVADSNQWQYFEPDRCRNSTRMLAQIKSACRLYFHPICPSCARYRGGEAYPCPQCPEHGWDNKNMELFSLLDGKATETKILGLNCPNTSSQILKGIANAFPNINVLLISVKKNPISDILQLVPTLTLLSLQVDIDDDGSDFESDGDNYLYTSSQVAAQSPVFSSLKTFKLQATGQRRFAFIKGWDMPVLAHLEVISSDLRGTPITQLLAKFGISLISLRLRIESEWVYLPGSIWEDMPLLEYLGTTIMADSTSWPKPPPDGHPLETFAILGEERFRSSNIPPELNARLKTVELTEGWDTLTSIADLHSWDDVPENLLRDCLSGSTFDHLHGPEPCLLCVEVLYSQCIERGLNYLDRTGRTFAESRGEEIVRRPSVYPP